MAGAQGVARGEEDQPMNFNLMIKILPDLLHATLITVQLISLSLLFGIMLAVPLAVLYASKRHFFSYPVISYIFFFRGTPLLVQIFLVYYGIAQFECVRASFLWPYLRQPFVCALITFVLHTAAYTANILRGGIEAVNAGEVEAAKACGLSTLQQYCYILLPQAFRIILPAYGNEMIAMLKATSLASTITVMELTGMANSIVSETFAPYEVFIMAAIIYLMLSLVLSRAVGLLEWFLNRHHRFAA